MPPVPAICCGLLLAAACQPAAAGVSSLRFLVSVSITPAHGCLSGAFGKQASTIVQVFCSTRQFVHIEGAPEKGPWSARGSAIRIAAGADAMSGIHAGTAPAGGAPYLGTGKSTASRVFDTSGDGAAQEVWVVF